MYVFDFFKVRKLCVGGVVVNIVFFCDMLLFDVINVLCIYVILDLVFI